MKTKFLRFIPLVLALIVSGWVIAGAIQPQNVAAQGNDLDAILARATVKGYLTSLTYSNRSSTLTNFYLSDDVVDSAAAQELNDLQVASFQIVGEEWLSDDVYQVRAAISPGNRLLVADVGQATYRWQIMNLIWGEGSVAAQTAATTQASTAAGAGSVATAGGSAPSAEVLAYHLNVRSGPGTNYPVQGMLDQGDTVTIVGTNEAKGWYQVSQNGQVIGWISASPTYVSTSFAIVNTPIVSAPQAPFAGGKLILQTRSGGDFYLVDANGTSLRYLSSGIDPTLSPDGTKIAFTRWSSGELGSVWIYDLASGTERHLLGETLQAKSPTWSPDGSRIVVNFQEGGRREIENRCISFSRKLPHRAYDIKIRGHQICFKLPPDTFWQLRSIDVATGSYQDLASQTYSFAPTWDPANSWRVVFAGSTGLQQLDINRNVYFPFTEDLRDRGPVFSPDGSQVAVSYKQHNHWEVYTISAADGSRNRLTKVPILGDSFNSAAPAWSPDGKQIAFITDRTGKWEFWVMNADGSNPRPLLQPEVASELSPEYHGVDERLIIWGK